MIEIFLEKLKEKGWTQQAIAEKAGIGRSFVCELMKGKACGTETLLKIAEAFGVTTDEVLGRKQTRALSPTQEKLLIMTDNDEETARKALRCAEDEKLLKKVRGQGRGEKAA